MLYSAKRCLKKNFPSFLNELHPVVYLNSIVKIAAPNYIGKKN